MKRAELTEKILDIMKLPRFRGVLVSLDDQGFAVAASAAAS